MIVVFSGIDGCGKTTYAKAATEYLVATGLNARYIHISRDSFYHFLLHSVIGKFSKSSQVSLERGLRNKKNKAYFSFTGTLKKILLLIDICIFNVIYGYFKHNKHRIILCDRYFYDIIVQMEYLAIAGKPFISFYRRLIVEPDIVFLLNTDPAVAFLRKREYDEEYFVSKHALYSAIYSVFQHIDVGEGTIEGTCDFICKQIEVKLRA